MNHDIASPRSISSVVSGSVLNEVIACMIYSTKFLAVVHATLPSLDPEYYSSNEQWVIASLTFKYYEKHKKAPGTKYLKNELLHHYKNTNSSTESQELVETLRKKLVKLKPRVLKNKSYLEDQVVKIAQQEKATHIVKKLIDLNNRGVCHGDALTEISGELRDVSHLGMSTSKLEMPISEIEEEPVEWLWPGWIPRRTVMVLDGDPGCGKSLITVKMTAVVTLGWCDGRKKKIGATNVLILSAEDDPASVIKPRLAVAKANLDRVFIERIEEDEQNKLLELFQLNEEGIARLEAALSRCKPGLVIIDTLFSYLGGQKDVLDPVTISRIVRQLSILAKKYDCTFLLIRHLTKDPKGRSIYRGQGPMSIIGGARHALLAGCDPNNIISRALVVNKSNLAPEDSVRGYEIVLEKRRIKGKWVEIPKIRWCETDLTKFAITAREKPEAVSQLDEAVEFLEMRLADGREEQKEVIKAAKQEKIKTATLDRAKKKLKIKSRKDGFAGVWFWEL